MKRILTAFLYAFTITFAAAAHAAEVEMHTSQGVIVLAIDEENAPATAANFLQYAEDGFYDGLIFHRVIRYFVIQGGGFNASMEKSETREPIAFEQTGLSNVKYSISMPRLADPNSATSQFFINLMDNPQLNGNASGPGYAVFGRVIGGMEVVDSIAAVITGNRGPFPDVPVDNIIINKVVAK